MNQFNKKLAAAKNRQRFIYIGVFSLLLIGAIFILVVIAASRGTRINISPEDAVSQASIHLDTGIGAIIGETLYSISTEPAIAVSADGFYSKTQVLSEKDFGKVMTITLIPLPAKIVLTSNPAYEKTIWSINGQAVATAEMIEHELEAGEYEISIDHPHFKAKSVVYKLGRGEILNKVIELDPIKGMLEINTKPTGASVLINDVEMGKTPLTLEKAGGYFDVSVMLDKYQSIVDTIEISRDIPEIQRNYRLELKEATVRLNLKPNDGSLTLNGILVKNTDSLSVKASIEHQLTYTRKGYFPMSKSFRLSENETRELTFELKKEMGLVDIESTPAADVEINGKNMGTTPLQVSLNAIEQNITLSKAGFRTVKKSVIPSAAYIKKVNVALIPERVARLNEAPAKYTHKAGGELKLFKPNDTFTMGANRSEPGQRANEFLKQIKLTREFYAGVTEVTNAEYSQYDANRKGDPKMPVTSISWIEAASFCNWLSQKEGLTPFYQISNNKLTGININSDGYRMLTEAEWEWLARKMGKKAQTKFVWGDDNIIPKHSVNVADESARGKVKVFVPKYNDASPEIAPVGLYAMEKSGLYDQGGNVSEWTHDIYSIVPPEKGKLYLDPVSKTIGDAHVVKGANWRSASITELRPSFREGLDGPRDDLGFRLGRYLYGGN
jgi:formylglycine-generating enzyme required for sulfatase activity